MTAAASDPMVSWSTRTITLLLATIVTLAATIFARSNFWEDFKIVWGGIGNGRRANIAQDGQVLYLSLDRAGGSAVVSRYRHFFAKLDMQIKPVPGNSAGTVTRFYMTTLGGVIHEEIDLEFLGNLRGDDYTLQTNIFAKGKGDREQRFRLWFDPTQDFHTYTIHWNPKNIIFYVDGTPIRVFKNLGSYGIPFPNSPMWLYCTLWDGSSWATQGGRVKINWSFAPFTASFRYFNSHWNDKSSWLIESLDSSAAAQERLRWVQNHFLTYNYCTDAKRFPQGLPPECHHNH